MAPLADSNPDLHEHDTICEMILQTELLPQLPLLTRHELTAAVDVEAVATVESEAVVVVAALVVLVVVVEEVEIIVEEAVVEDIVVVAAAAAVVVVVAGNVVADIDVAARVVLAPAVVSNVIDDVDDVTVTIPVVAIVLAGDDVLNPADMVAVEEIVEVVVLGTTSH